jgi:CheY-like chemotaxis protein
MSTQVDEPPAAGSSRVALLIATSKYEDSRLRPLVAPEPDAKSLAEVLSKPEIGAFTVQTVVNQPAHLIARAIERHLTGRRLDDFVLLHISCHGVKDADGQLYFASSDTQRDLLASTTVSAAFLRDQLNRSRARTILVLLDCCYSGAFVSGIRGDSDLHLREQLLSEPPGRGRVVITASDAVQYAWEGDSQAGDGQLGGFTTALIHGLRTGEADLDGDGRVSIQDLFDYLDEKVWEVRADQRPRKWEFGVHGTIWIAHAPQRPRPSPRERELILIVDDDRDIVRFIEVNLRLEGFEVITALDGADGLAKALDLQPSLIVLDVMMPGMDGFEVCTRLRESARGRHLPIIFLTAKSLSADKVLGLTAGADDYMIKPFDPMELIARIKTTVQRVHEYEAQGAQRAINERTNQPT